MAYARGGMSRALLKYPDLDLSRTRLIGWGAGQAFRDYFPLTGLQLEYTLCPRQENHGRTIHGVPVRSTEALREESPQDVLVVIFSAYSAEIMNEIRDRIGPYRAVRAVEFGDNAAQISELEALAGALRGGLSLHKAPAAEPAEVGMFMQGPLTGFTPMALAFHRMRYPGMHLSVVTWNGEDPALVAQCRPWCDELVQIEPPPPNGYDTRNLITRSCKEGARLLQRAGVRYAIRARTDAVIFGSPYRTLERMFGDGSRGAGKIGVLLAASWAYVPFHFSDKLMLCRTEDMVALWSLPEDPRGKADFPPAGLTDPGLLGWNFLDYRHISWESRLWGSHARQLGYPADTLEDAYRFARDRLLELDSDSHMFSIKHVPMFNLKLRPMLEPTVEWWKEMQSDFDGTLDHLRQVSSSGMTLQDFFAKRVG
ncbi:hypothetical protein GT347_08125 [Xylophilus rhododendri]|uniref:WavE lipopolysaccharide synthesis n=1 Tax=Xylophilus rhododendri TaxID=2697032 RepID=A0A857J4J7_9BURK|nr:hypothetical protein [Xylophilus rhododendri]QHI97962.1 hypothetical protein GT347_08125 [Xylophilus rhododendri]